MVELPKRLPEPSFKEFPGIEVDDPTTCGKSPNSHHRFLLETSDGDMRLACLYCRKEADPMPPDPMDRWAPHD